MSASHAWEWSPASADGLLTNEECFMLLDVDVFNDDDLFKSFSSAAPKAESVAVVSGVPPQDELSASLYPPSPPDLKPSRAQLATDLLHQIENTYKQENIFPNWLEEKVELPMFESIPASVERAEPLPLPLPGPQLVPQPTEELLREFETVYGAVELTHLTPPQSPPGPATQLLLSYAQHAQCAPPAPPAPQAPASAQWLPAYDAELVAVEELVRSRAAELASPSPSPSPSHSHSHSPAPGSAGSSSASPRSSPPSSPRSSCTEDEWAAPRGERRPGPGPYSRATDDRRTRKKEQNKNAATRYRQKKKAEIEVLLGEESALRGRHADLGDKCADLQREIKYLKGLMRDLFKAKGLIK